MRPKVDPTWVRTSDLGQPPNGFILLSEFPKFRQGNQDLEGQYQRWQVMLSAYDVIIKYKKGSTHELADVPSRFPLPTTVDKTGAREPAIIPPPTRVDLSDLTPEEREIALVELAEHNNAVAAFHSAH